MLKKAFYCDRCGKVIDGELRMHNNRYVGKEGRLMIHISKDSCKAGPARQDTMYFCPECWGRQCKTCALSEIFRLSIGCIGRLDMIQAKARGEGQV